MKPFDLEHRSAAVPGATFGDVAITMRDECLDHQGVDSPARSWRSRSCAALASNARRALGHQPASVRHVLTQAEY